MEIKEIFELANKDPRIFTAATFARLWEHIENGKPFGIVSTFRSELTLDENKENQKRLKQSLNAKGYGSINIKGYWKEPEEPESKPIIEQSLFVPKITQEDIVKIGQRWNQTSVIWGSIDEGITEIFMNGGKKSYGKVTTQNLENAYSEFKGRSFKFSTFSHLRFEPIGMFSGLDWSRYVERELNKTRILAVASSSDAEQADAQWISPDGKIFEVKNRHINYILDHPETFGLTREEIVATYKKYNERIGLEGKAREEIMQNLIREGWIRVRFFNEGWHIQVNRIINRVKDFLFDWASTIKNTMEKAHQYTPVYIMPLSGTDMVSTIGDIARGQLHTAAKKKHTAYRYPVQ